ncbi:MAG: hypothetical protein ACQESG_06250 [Nanobdellota archaeon]
MIVLIILVSGISYGSLDDAKQVIDDYYRYSTEKDVDSYVALFDQEYLDRIYGEDHRELFTEIFNYFEIQEYDIDYQYYTESEESMTVFFNLQTTTMIEEEAVDQDNDMVAFFTKSTVPELRYILLQEEFVGQMNREFIYETAITAIVEKNSDLKAEAEEKGVSLTDHNFEELIDAHHDKHSTRWWLWAVLIALLVPGYLYRKQIARYARNNGSIQNAYQKAKPLLRQSGKSLKKGYERAVPIIKDHAKKLKASYDKGKPAVNARRLKKTRPKR